MKLPEAFLKNPEKAELFALLVFFATVSVREKIHIPGLSLLFILAFSALCIIYFFSLFVKMYPDNRNAHMTFRLSRIAMITGSTGLLFFVNGIEQGKVVILASALLLAIIPIKSTTIDHQRPGKNETIRISIWLLILAALLFVLTNSENQF